MTSPDTDPENTEEDEENEGDNEGRAERLSLAIGPAEHGLRLDRALSLLCPDLSRTRIQSLIAVGACLLGNRPATTPSRKVQEGDQVVLTLPPAEDALPAPEPLPLDILYEDADLIVLNKAAGMVVHPAIRHSSGTLVNALLSHCGDSLSGINGVRRPGIVHRLDKDTSGLMLVAKTDIAHRHLARQLESRTLSRSYHALVIGVPAPVKGVIETLIGRHPTNRLKMAVLRTGGREAVTHFHVIQNFRDVFSLVQCRLKTGRTHQIRVHMDHIGHPLLGDPLYGPPASTLRARLVKGEYDAQAVQTVLSFGRQALHAAEISFLHPVSGDQMTFSSPSPPDFSALAAALA